jgi:hypothetical protein
VVDIDLVENQAIGGECPITVRKSLGYQQLLATVRRQNRADRLPISGRPVTNVDRDIDDRAAQYGNQLRLGLRRALKMQTADRIG